MKFIQTLHFDKSINPFKYNFGWAAPEYHLMGWALSCLQLKHFYKDVDLYCNSKAGSLLIDQLGLPYSNVHVTHDDFNIVNEKLWALPKVFTYSLQDEPFLHLDGDFFLFKKLPDSLLGGELIAQNIEVASNYYLTTQTELMKHFTYFPDCVKKDFDSTNSFRAVNAGILGGSNIAFIKEYTELAFKYINKNARQLFSINADMFNVFFEQHLFYSLAKEKDLPVKFLIDGIIIDNQYKHLGDFHEVPCNKNYLHLIGQYKKDEYTCRLMALKLRQLYPEYYYRIIALCKTELVPLSISFYGDEKLSTELDFIQYNTHSKDIFLTHSHTKEPAITNNTDTIILETPAITALSLLQNIVTEINDFSNFTKDALINDMDIFSENLRKILLYNKKFPQDYIYGRDVDSVSWFCELFGNDLNIPDKIIARCSEISIIKSGFDWAGLLNQYNRIGVEYYDLLELSPGEFYNLIIPEIYGDGFSLQDLDEMEKIILEELVIPVSIKELFIKMRTYVEEDILENHLAEYEQLIIVMLKQLVVKKAVNPFGANNYILN